MTDWSNDIERRWAEDITERDAKIAELQDVLRLSARAHVAGRHYTGPCWCQDPHSPDHEPICLRARAALEAG